MANVRQEHCSLLNLCQQSSTSKSGSLKMAWLFQVTKVFAQGSRFLTAQEKLPYQMQN